MRLVGIILPPVRLTPSHLKPSTFSESYAEPIIISTYDCKCMMHRLIMVQFNHSSSSSNKDMMAFAQDFLD